MSSFFIPYTINLTRHLSLVYTILWAIQMAKEEEGGLGTYQLFVVAYQRDIKCERINTVGWIPATPQWHGRPHPTRPRHDQMCGRGGFQATYVINLLLATIAQLRNIFKVKHIYLNICDHLQTYEYTSLIISIFTSRFPDWQSPSPSPSPLNQCANIDYRLYTKLANGFLFWRKSSFWPNKKLKGDQVPFG